MCNEVVDNNNYVELTDDYLEIDNFTVSFSLAIGEDNKKWISFHDYYPDYMLNLRNNKLLLFYNGQLYEHNIGSSGVFFGERFESYITPVFSPRLKDKEKVLYPFYIRSLNWNTDIEDTEIKLLNKTWTSISIHNSEQGTRQIKLIPFDADCALLEQYGVYNCKKIKNRWVFNYAFNNKIDTRPKTWTEKLGNFFVINVSEDPCDTFDSVPNTTRLFDDFAIIKLVFDNQQDYDLFFYELNIDLSIVTQ